MTSCSTGSRRSTPERPSRLRRRRRDRRDETPNPHLAADPVLSGAVPGEAEAAALILHGRGGVPSLVGDTAIDADAGPLAAMRELERRLDLPEVAFVLPVADADSWYPKPFTAPREENEPRLGDALLACEAVLATLADLGWPADRVALVGFSQGACLALEHVARRPRRYRAVVALTGGLIGPDDDSLARPEGLDGTPLLITTKEDDAWVAADRVRTSAAILADAGADVDLRILPGAEHSITEGEIEAARELIRPPAR